MINIFKKHSVNFSKFMFIGVIASILSIFFMWLFVDIFRIQTVIAATSLTAVFLVEILYV